MSTAKKKTIAYFAGAGAECSYGLPNGGKFALDLFRCDTTKDKEEFKRRRDQIDSSSPYASKWLPRDFERKSVTTFGKSSYEQLIKGSLEYKGQEIKDFFRYFDEKAGAIAEQYKKNGIDIISIMEKYAGITIGSKLYGHEIKLVEALENSDEFFNSEWLGIILTLYQQPGLDVNLKKHLRKAIKSLFEILIGAGGEKLARQLNENVFEKSIDTIDIFDDISSFIEIDYRNTGMGALEFVIDYGSIEPDAGKGDVHQIMDFIASIVEKLMTEIMNYQELIDSNWHYLYSPRVNWGKFCKISIFLYTAKRYIKEMADKNRSAILKGDGYYHDILKMDSHFERLAVGTTNYNTFVKDILTDKVFYLNGSVTDMYDPYANRIVDESELSHMTVPFMFTQSGIKPLTAVSISRRYVDLYDSFKQADHIVVIGFGFQSDDGHVNGVFRDLIEMEKKKISILHYTSGSESQTVLKRKYAEKLRLSSDKFLDIICVGSDRKIIGTDDMWYEYLINKLY